MPLWLYLLIIVVAGTFMWVRSRSEARRKPQPPPDLSGFERKGNDAS
ncbi:MAG: hypothetical protein ACM3ML_07700 [Micromonosporaceae bacterium]